MARPNASGRKAKPGGKKKKGFGTGGILRFTQSVVDKLSKEQPGSTEKEGYEDDLNREDDDYEYEEEIPQEESKKNRRYDDVDVYEYELPDDFEDEEIDEELAFENEENEESKRPIRKEIDLNEDEDEEVGEEEEEDYEDDEYEEDDLDYDEDENDNRINDGIEREEEEGDEEGGEEEFEEEDEGVEDEEDEERHANMILEVTGKDLNELERVKRNAKVRNSIVSEPYPESEFNLTSAKLNQSSQLESQADYQNESLSVNELLSSLKEASGIAPLAKKFENMSKTFHPIQPALPIPVKERLERKAGYVKTKQEVSKWQHLVNENRNAETLVLNKPPPVDNFTVAALAVKFQPSTKMEKDVSEVLNNYGLDQASAVIEAENLELNKLTVDEVRERQNRLAKMRSLLFRTELKAKRIKKIKSKAYHRIELKTKKKKMEKLEAECGLNDPEAEKENAIKQEFKRAQERMTLKHRNTSKWAKRILEKGLANKPTPEAEGLKAAIAEQLRTHASLTKKMHSANIGLGTSDEEEEDDEEDWSSEEGEEDLGGGEGLILERKKKRILDIAKEKTMKVLEGDAEADIPATGLFALPFMTRAIEKKRKLAEEEAMAVLKDFEDDTNEKGDFVFNEGETQSSRKVFGSQILHLNRQSQGEFIESKSRKSDGDEEEDSDNNEQNNQLEEERDNYSDGIEVENSWNKGSKRNKKASLNSTKKRGKEKADFTLEKSALNAKLPIQVDGGYIKNPGDDLNRTVFVNQPITVELESESKHQVDPESKNQDEPENSQSNTKKKNKKEKNRGTPMVNKDKDETPSHADQELGNSHGNTGNSTLQTIEIKTEKDTLNSNTNGHNYLIGNNPWLFVKGEQKDHANTSGRVNEMERNQERRNETTSVTNHMLVHSNPNSSSNGNAEKSRVKIMRRNPEGDKENGIRERKSESGTKYHEDDNTGDGAVKGNEVSTKVFSQTELIQRAFAGDDVAEEFKKEKEKVLDEETKKEKGSVILPGWGEWENVQKKRGPPAWLIKERKEIEERRKAAMARRTDAKMSNVIISEKRPWLEEPMQRCRM